MSEEFHFLSDLALILISAGFVTIIFKLLKQPLVPGYILAGFLVSPYCSIFPSVVDMENVHEWSEIGIVFLLFALGLDFSFKKLFRIGNSAFIAAGIEILGMILIGFITGRFLGWNGMESLFFGGMLAMSSTMIIIKVFEELNLSKERFSDVVMVILILQDLVAIIMMVMLSTTSASQHFEGETLLRLLMKLVFFLILWFVVGIALLPTFFKKLKKWINDETLLIFSIGLCFGMVGLAKYLGFSTALGAFVMGSILAETIEGEKIQNLIKGIKVLFGAIFFVSVGMLLDITIIGQYWDTIIVISILSIFVKGFISTAGVLIAGEPFKVAVRSGFSLSQVGEFAFIIASLGVSLKVMRPEIYPIIVAASVITIFTTPFAIRFSAPFSTWIFPRFSPKVKRFLNNYEKEAQNIKKETVKSKIIKNVLVRMIVLSVIIIAILLFCFSYLNPFIFKIITHRISHNWAMLVNTFVPLSLIAPFLVGLMTGKQKDIELYAMVWKESKAGRYLLLSWIILRTILVVFFVIILISKYFTFSIWIIIVIALSIVFLIFISRKAFKRYSKIESYFLSNLNLKEEEKKREE